jgi:phosphoribosylamine--glycine ligase
MPQPKSVLVVGGGGREHAIAWSLAAIPDVARIHVAPGNGGTCREPKTENVSLPDADIPGLLRFARERQIALTVVGPEVPLALGIVDAFQVERLPIFGPSKRAARLETSKSWARRFMERHEIPHPSFTVAESPEDAERAVRELDGSCVVKADGLAAGKGVIVCRELDEALAAVRSLMRERKYGDAGERVLVEQLLDGPELSVMAAVDGRGYVMFPPAQDYKRLLDGDTGPNTGGMGSYSPPPIAVPQLLRTVRSRIIEPTVAGMADEGTPFTGCLYCGLMLTSKGPSVIEYNVRFGDPETQAQLPLAGDALLEALLGSARGSLDDAQVVSEPGRASVCVVLASAGYPEQARIGEPVRGIDAAEQVTGVKVIHAGTRAADGGVVTSGGRALNVVCVRDDLAGAMAGAYSAIGGDGVHFAGMHYRRDIAARAIPARPPI